MMRFKLPLLYTFIVGRVINASRSPSPDLERSASLRFLLNETPFPLYLANMQPMKTHALPILIVILAITVSQSTAAPVGSGDIGTVSAVDDSGTIRFVPWGKTDTDMENVATTAETEVSVAAAAAKVADLKAGMWIKLDEMAGSGEAKRLSAGQFLAEDGDKLVIFKALPGELLQRDVKDWYTNEAGGIRFKVQLMRSSGDPKILGANLRPASYREPAGGFVFYLPLTLKGAVLNYGGPKVGRTVPDADGKLVINKDTVTETYWKHPRNPSKPDLGSVSGLTELTIRKLPKAMP